MEPTINSSIKPKFGRVLISRKITEKSAGGIIMPGNSAKRHANCQGVIVALGETAGWTTSYTDTGEQVTTQALKVGDTVIFGQHAGAWLDQTYNKLGDTNDDGTLFICQDEDILAIKE